MLRVAHRCWIGCGTFPLSFLHSSSMEVRCFSSHEGVEYRPTRGLVNVVKEPRVPRPKAWQSHFCESTRSRVVRRVVSVRCSRGNDGSRVRENHVGIWKKNGDGDSTSSKHSREMPSPTHTSHDARELGRIGRGGIGSSVYSEDPHVEKLLPFLRGRLRNSFRTAFEEWHRAEVAVERAWKSFALVPLMLLCRLQGTGTVGRDELATRGD